MPQEQFHTIIDKLITNQEIKNILFKQIKEKPRIFETEINQNISFELYNKKLRQTLNNRYTVLSLAIFSANAALFINTSIFPNFFIVCSIKDMRVCAL